MFAENLLTFDLWLTALSWLVYCIWLLWTAFLAFERRSLDRRLVLLTLWSVIIIGISLFIYLAANPQGNSILYFMATAFLGLAPAGLAYLLTGLYQAISGKLLSLISGATIVGTILATALTPIGPFPFELFLIILNGFMLFFMAWLLILTLIYTPKISTARKLILWAVWFGAAIGFIVLREIEGFLLGALIFGLVMALPSAKPMLTSGKIARALRTVPSALILLGSVVAGILYWPSILFELSHAPDLFVIYSLPPLIGAFGLASGYYQIKAVHAIMGLVLFILALGGSMTFGIGLLVLPFAFFLSALTMGDMGVAGIT